MACGGIHRHKDRLAISHICFNSFKYDGLKRLPLWSSDQSSWLQIQRSGFDSPALTDFLRSSASGTGFTQPREYN
jgi:hypothetical protein